MESKNRKYCSLYSVIQAVNFRILGIVSCLLFVILVSGCVSMKSYREVKSNLLYQEMALQQYRYALDSLKSSYDELLLEKQSLENRVSNREVGGSQIVEKPQTPQTPQTNSVGASGESVEQLQAQLRAKDEELAKYKERVEILEEEYNLLLDEFSREVGEE